MADQEGFAIWLTGLPASGKSTLAVHLADTLQQRELPVQILDSDELRQILTPQATYSLEEREWFYNTLVYIGTLLTRHAVNVIIAATAHRRAHRDKARSAFQRFVEVYVRCPLEVCIKRDRKGIYKMAQTGKASTVPGVQVFYEAHESPEITVDTEEKSASECVQYIMNYLENEILLVFDEK